MRNSERVSSRVFLGVMLVPITARARKVNTMASTGNFYTAVTDRVVNKEVDGIICKMPVVALSSYDTFTGLFDRSMYLQRSVAQALKLTKVITEKTYDDFIKAVRRAETDKARSRIQTYADEFFDVASHLGLNVTKEQREKINRALKIEVM